MDKQEKELEEILRIFDKAPSPSSERNNHAQMRQNNLQSRQVSQNPIDAERTVRATNQTANKRQPPSSKGRYLSPKRKAAIKRRKWKRAVIVSLFALLIVILIVVLICKGCAGGKKDLSVLQGTWYYDQYTEYEFDGKGNAQLYGSKPRVPSKIQGSARCWKLNIKRNGKITKKVLPFFHCIVLNFSYLRSILLNNCI